MPADPGHTPAWRDEVQLRQHLCWKSHQRCAMDSAPCAHSTLPLSLSLPSFWVTGSHCCYHHLRGSPGQQKAYVRAQLLKVALSQKVTSSVTETKELTISHLPILLITPQGVHCARLFAESSSPASKRTSKTWSQLQGAVWGLLAALDTVSYEPHFTKCQCLRPCVDWWVTEHHRCCRCRCDRPNRKELVLQKLSEGGTREY